MLDYRKHKKFIIFLADILVVLGSYSLIYILELRTDLTLVDASLDLFLVLISYTAILFAFGLYHTIWSVAGYYDYRNIVLSNAISLILLIIFSVTLGFNTISSYEIILSAVYILLGTLGIRMYFRIRRRLFIEKIDNKDGVRKELKKVLIIGAGEAASLIIKEIHTHPQLNMHIMGLVDDSHFKQNEQIAGYKVLGTTDDIINIVDEYVIDEILFAMPSATQEQKIKILEKAQQSKARLKTLPGMYEVVDQVANLESIRDVDISDLLGRPEIKLNNERISEYIENKVVLVTGGGGSIGSEISRQIANLNPKQLIILDNYENNAYAVELELRKRHPDLNLLVLIATVRDKQKMDKVFHDYKPNVIFHAAAHKHVPLMEISPDEAIKNNVFGTLNVARSARKYKSERFIFISTDKAVNPTNIMGATKRLCEMIVQTIDEESETDFVAVRFGNVLGSNESVIPIFKKQIKAGGPLTLTHSEITRYFMTIPEAVQLVLQAGSYAKGGEIFVLDMGEPVKIYDLAENLIRLSGFEPHTDIEIKEIGLRPGEKLFEELLINESLKETPHELIFIDSPNSFDKTQLLYSLKELEELIHNDSFTNEKVKEIMASIVNTYHPTDNS